MPDRKGIQTVFTTQIAEKLFISLRRGVPEVELPGEAVANHDELMSNFFAQPGTGTVNQ